MEKEQQEFEVFKIYYEAEQESGHKLFEATIEAGASAIKAAFILNGAATIALLTLIGNSTLDKPVALWPDYFSNTVWAAHAFAIGTGFAAATSGIRYVSQMFYAISFSKKMTPTYSRIMSHKDYEDWTQNSHKGSRLERHGDIVTCIAIFLIVLSYICFFGGVVKFGSTF